MEPHRIRNHPHLPTTRRDCAEGRKQPRERGRVRLEERGDTGGGHGPVRVTHNPRHHQGQFLTGTAAKVPVAEIDRSVRGLRRVKVTRVPIGQSHACQKPRKASLVKHFVEAHGHGTLLALAASSIVLRSIWSAGPACLTEHLVFDDPDQLLLCGSQERPVTDAAAAAATLAGSGTETAALKAAARAAAVG